MPPQLFCCIFGSWHCIQSAIVQKSEAHMLCRHVSYLGIYAVYMNLALNRSSALWYFKFGDATEICTRTMSNLYLGWPQLCYLPMQPTHGYRKSCRPSKFTLHPKMLSILHTVNTTWSWIYGQHSQCINLPVILYYIVYYILNYLYLQMYWKLSDNVAYNLENPHLLVVLLLWLLRMLVSLMKKVQDWSTLTNNMLWATSL